MKHLHIKYLLSDLVLALIRQAGLAVERTNQSVIVGYDTDGELELILAYVIADRPDSEQLEQTKTMSLAA